MAEKGFGVKEVNLIGASGTPTITSPNNLNLNAVNVAISTNVSIGGTLTYEDVTNIDSVGLITAREGIFVPDNKEIKIGNTASSPDLKIYHDGTNSRIQDGTNTLRIIGDSIKLNNGSVSKNFLVAENDAVQLMYDNSTKLTTLNTGVTVTGTLTATTF